MNKISVDEAKKRGCLQILHAKVMHQWYDNFEDATDYDLHRVNRNLTFELLDECLINCGISSQYAVLPYPDGIAVIIFKIMDSWDASRLSYAFEDNAKHLGFRCNVYFPGQNYDADDIRSYTAMQVMTIS